jgi:hypothetical protein
MHKNNRNLHIALLLVMIQGLFSGCSHHNNSQSLMNEQKPELPPVGCGYTIAVPTGWHEVVKEEDVKKHIFWSFSNNNYTKFTENPLFRAWDAPEETNAFLTIMELKRHRNLGMGGFYDEVIRGLREMGWTIQETGTTKIGGQRCKWWVQSHSGGAVQQQCFSVASGPYYYILAFSTSYLSEEKQRLFQQIAQTVTFYEGI